MYSTASDLDEVFADYEKQLRADRADAASTAVATAGGQAGTIAAAPAAAADGAARAAPAVRVALGVQHDAVLLPAKASVGVWLKTLIDRDGVAGVAAGLIRVSRKHAFALAKALCDAHFGEGIELELEVRAARATATATIPDRATACSRPRRWW